MYEVIPFLMPKQFLIVAKIFPFRIRSSNAEFPAFEKPKSHRARLFSEIISD